MKYIKKLRFCQNLKCINPRNLSLEVSYYYVAFLQITYNLLNQYVGYGRNFFKIIAEYLCCQVRRGCRL